MAIINRDYLVIVDVRQSTINFNKDKIIFYITDKNTSNIFVNLVTNISDNEYVDNYVSIEDAQNYKVTMNIVKPDNTYKIIEGTLLDEEKALYEFNLEEECKDQIGTYTCDIQSIRVDDEVERIITSNRFLYKVKAGVLNDLNEVIQSAESYPIVVELFDKLSYIERYEDERQANEEARNEAEEQRQNRYDGLIDTILSRIQSMDDKLIEGEERLTSKEQEVDDCIEENTAKIDAKIQETDNKINELDTMFSENLNDVNEKIDETNAKLIEMDKSMTTNTSKINAKIDEANDVIGEMKTSISNNTAKVDAKLVDVEKRISTKEKEVDNYISSAKTTLNTYQNTTTNRIDNYLRDKSVALDKYQSNKDIVINNKLNDALNQIDEKLGNLDLSGVDLTGYAKTEDIPTRVSQLTNDSNFVNSTFVTSKIAEAQLGGGEVDLSEYRTKADNTLNTTNKTIVGGINEIKASVDSMEIPTKTSDLINDSGYLTEHQSLIDYAKKTDLHSHDNKTILDNITQDKFDSWDNKSNFSGSYNDLTDKPTIPTKTSQLTNDRGYLTEHQSLEGYARTTDIPTRTSQLANDSNYATETYVDDKTPHIISEEVILTIPNSSLLTIFDESGEYKELVYDTDIIGLNQTELYYVVEFNGNKFLVKPSYNSYSDQTGIILQMNYSEDAWWYLDICDKANANWDTDATKTRIGFSAKGITYAITTDLLIKKININYLDNNVLNPNTRILNSLQIGLDSGIIEHDIYEADFGVNSLSVGEGSKALGVNSTAMGVKTTTTGKYSHAEGNSTTANGESSHAEGDTTTASGKYSHTEGFHTIASSVYQHVQGRYNIEDSTNTYAHIVGNGRSESTRSNAYTLDWNGNGWYKGKLSQDGTPTENRDLTTKEYVDNAIGNIDASNMTITDTANNFTSTNVEEALDELMARIVALENNQATGGGSTGGDTPGGGNTENYVTEGLSLYLDSSNTSNTTTTLADMSGNGNDFTSAVNITTNDSGRVVLDGSQYFSNTSYQPHTTTDNDFTFEFFGDIESSGGGRNYFFSYGSRNGFSWDEQQGLSGQMGSGDVIWAGTDTVNGHANRIAPIFGERHVIITKNGTTYSIYADGTLIQSIEYTTSWSDSSYTNFRLFIRYNGSNMLRGTMKYVRWYTKGFTAEEVIQNYTSKND